MRCSRAGSRRPELPGLPGPTPLMGTMLPAEPPPRAGRHVSPVRRIPERHSGLSDYFGDRLGADFSNIRIHNDSNADQLAKAISARAFAHRSHLYFAAGEYDPASTAGRGTLAHELAHTIQQGGAAPRPGAVSQRTISGSNGLSIQRMARLDTSQSNVIGRSWPWGRGGPSGTDYNAKTDAGSVVAGWVADSPWKIEWHYWCHGLSLGTFNSDGFSVYSGPDLVTVLRDEYTDINPVKAAAGDLAVFMPNFDHSAKFTSVVLNGADIDEDKSRLQTKNGQAAEKNDSLTGIKTVYPGHTYRILHHK